MCSILILKHTLLRQHWVAFIEDGRNRALQRLSDLPRVKKWSGFLNLYLSHFRTQALYNSPILLQEMQDLSME